MPALMYHDVVPPGGEDSSGFPGRDAALYKVSPALFEQQLIAIARAAETPGKTLPPVLTFDDGGVSALRAADALERHGLIGHFFITVDYIGAKGFVGERDVRELHARGHVVGSHSCSHPLRMGHCSWSQLLDEWGRSRAVLGALIAADVTVASVPGGDFSPLVAEAAARTGFTRLFTSEPVSAAKEVSGLRVQGRFTIRRGTDVARAVALARGDGLPCARQRIIWTAKKLTKRVGGARYLELRRCLLGGTLR
jgi:hypothetical protein